MDERRVKLTLAKKAAFARLQGNPDFHLLVHEMNAMAKQALREQLDINPLKDPETAMERKLLRTVLTVTIPRRMQEIINYDPTAPDKQAVPEYQWSFKDFWNQIASQFRSR